MINSEDYDYDSLVGYGFQTEIDYIPEEHTAGALEAINSIASNGVEISMGAKIATVYDRNGWASHDNINGPRNSRYSSDHDDVIVQLTVRVNGARLKSKATGHEKLSDLIDLLKDEYKAKEIEELKKELLVAEEAARQAQAIIENKKTQLSTLENS